MKISVIGCGRWGSLITWYLSEKKGFDVTLYGREGSEHMQAFLKERKNSPAATARRSPCGLFSALLLEIIRETVMGIPPVPTVRNSPKRERATWYKPSPSAPISRERTIRYKKPSPRSATDSPVTIEAFL